VEDLRHVLLNKIVVMEHLFRNVEGMFRDVERQMASMSEAVQQCRKMLENGKK